MLYDYAVKGHEEFQRLCLDFERGKAPSVVMRDGVRYVRCPARRARETFAEKTARIRTLQPRLREYLHVSNALPREGDPDDVGAPHYVGPYRKPGFKTRREIENYRAKQADHGRKWKYG